MITLHFFPGNASLAPHILLRELGVPFELQLVDRAQGAQKSPAFLKLNPNGQIPVLVDGELGSVIGSSRLAIIAFSSCRRGISCSRMAL